MKFQKTLATIIGAVLLLVGFNYLFEIFDIAPRQWLLLAAGILLLFFGLKNRNGILRDIGVFSITIGIAALGESFRVLYPFMKTIYYASVAAALLIVGAIRKNNWVLVGGFIVAAIAVTELLQSILLPLQLVYAYSFITLATFFVILFIFKNQDWGYMPLILGIMCYLLSVPQFLEHAKYITEEMTKGLSAGLMIITGVIVMIKVYQIGTKEKKSE